MDKPDPALGLQRARAATSLMLALPGSAYLFQGEELGLPEVIDLPDNLRQDPTFRRTSGERSGRDGCRVPLPWEANQPAYGFSTTGKSSLPQPLVCQGLAREAQRGQPWIHLEIYPHLIDLRASHRLGRGELHWLDGFSDDIVAFANNGIAVIANTGQSPLELPAGQVLHISGPLDGEPLPADTTAWVKIAN